MKYLLCTFIGRDVNGGLLYMKLLGMMCSCSANPGFLYFTKLLSPYRFKYCYPLSAFFFFLGF